MEKDSNIIFRINSDLKQRVANIAKANGYTLSDIINAALLDLVDKNKISSCYNKYLPKHYSNNKLITINIIKKAVREIIEKQQAVGISKVYLFGSFSRGEEKTSSDIDLRFEIDGNFTLFDHSNIRLDLKEVLGREIDIVTQDIEKLDKFFYNQIKKDQICIYERD